MEIHDEGNQGIKASTMQLRCECGVIISANTRQELIESARAHYVGAHPALDPGIPAELILAMAEEVHT